MTIYFDLDETLIYTTRRNKRDSAPKDADFSWEFDIYPHSIYDVRIRPSAIALIRLAQRYSDNVKILTSAIRDYAEGICKEAGFPFGPEDIVARHDYLCSHPGYGQVTHTDQDTDSCLLDNLWPGDFGAMTKMRYLGITDANYIRIEAYYGNPDRLDIDEIEKQLRGIISCK